MKKILLVSTVALSTFMFSCNNDNSSNNTPTTGNQDEIILDGEHVTPDEVVETTTLSVDKKEHDFGTITDDAPVETTFVVTNTGDKPLVISNAQGSCGCTVPEYPKDPIIPGESSEIKVVFNPSGKEGAQNKTVTITANTEPATTILNIKTNVVKK